jgi:hypothetical protein
MRCDRLFLVCSLLLAILGRTWSCPSKTAACLVPALSQLDYPPDLFLKNWTGRSCCCWCRHSNWACR